ncbi:MAG TPA: hypothetical protein VH092_29630 [Urbifossiella sp.]|jgi:hypothetical protein|nr:hypothetical protein [Urbifossiella sp.]
MTWHRRFGLSGFVALACAAIVPAQPPAAGGGPPAIPKGLDVIPRDGFLVMTVDVAKLWDDPALKAVRDWIVDLKRDPIAETIGVTAAEVERLTVYVPVFGDRIEPMPVVLVTTRRPYNEARVVKNLRAGGGGPDVQRLGNLIRIPNQFPFETVVLTDDRGLLLVPQAPNGEGGGSVAALAGQLLARKADGQTGIEKHTLFVLGS